MLPGDREPHLMLHVHTKFGRVFKKKMLKTYYVNKQSMVTNTIVLGHLSA